MSNDITDLVHASPEDRNALARLMEEVYADLKKLAAKNMAGEARQITMSPTGLVHEAYFRLVERIRNEGVAIANRQHFYALASRIMRNVLCDQARTRLAQKRGGHEQHESIDSHHGVASQENYESLLAIDDALARLEQINPRWARVVECRFFAGLSDQETAETLDMALRSVQRDWHNAREWLAENLR
jgi:RNA polymerase sigma factor (TIGR02999 family)